MLPKAGGVFDQNPRHLRRINTVLQARNDVNELNAELQEAKQESLKRADERAKGVRG